MPTTRHADLALRLHDVMLDAAGGSRRWWPADYSGPRAGRDEIVIGAVLTQNTAWKNVERALANLREAGALDLSCLAGMVPDAIAPLIRPSGYFNLKSRRLHAVARFFVPDPHSPPRFAELAARPLDDLRADLLAVHGVGPETADSILLYALGLPTFVIDAYTLRIGRRHGIFTPATTYEQARAWFSARLAADPALYNEYHALLVFIGNRYCKPEPRCGECPLAPRDC